MRFLFVFLVGQGEVKILPTTKMNICPSRLLIIAFLSRNSILIQKISQEGMQEGASKIRLDWSKVVKHFAVYPSCATVRLVGFSRQESQEVAQQKHVRDRRC